MKLQLDLRKSLTENANDCFERGKKAKKKLKGLEKALKDSEKKLSEMEKKKETGFKAAEPAKKRKKKWFEKFRWFHSSEGFLVLGGRDTQSNEEIVKKHMGKSDLYFHAEIYGAPHCVLKTAENIMEKSPQKKPSPKKPGKKTLEEAARFAASYSNAWREGLSSADVYSVSPGQVSKSAPSGESLGAGAFMIHGKRNWFKKTPLDLAVGVKGENISLQIICAPISAAKKHSKIVFRLKQGKMKKGEAAKSLKARLEKKTGKTVDLDELLSMLPNGGIGIE